MSFLKKIVNVFKVVKKGARVIEAGNVSNAVASVVASEVATSVMNGISLDPTDIVCKAIFAKVKAKYPNLALDEDVLLPLIKELVHLYRGLHEDPEKYANNKSYISEIKRQIAFTYLELGIYFGKKLFSYLLEKYILKGKIA